MDPGGVDRLPLMDERWKDVDEDFSGKRVTRSFVRAQRSTEKKRVLTINLRIRRKTAWPPFFFSL